MHRLIFIVVAGCMPAVALGQPSAFTYQGQLKNGGLPVNGLADMRFSLYASNESSTPVAGPIIFDGSTLAPVPITNGLFGVSLDFGVGALQQGGEWLEIEVRVPHSVNDTGAYTVLNPRQQLTAAPFALSVPGLASTEAGGVEVAGDIHTPGEVIASAFSSNSPLVFKVNPSNTECARFDDANCFLGLGTANPQARLHIGGVPGVDGLMFPDGSVMTTAAGLGGGDGFWSASGSNIYNNNGGNVGIGTTAPTESFHLVGNPLHQVVARFDNPGANTGGSWLTTAHTASGREWSFGVNSSDGGFDFFNTFFFGNVVRFSRTGDILAQGNLTLAPNASPVLYTGMGSTELNRYLQLINTSLAPSASGLKAGGVLVSDSYAYANPGKNDLIVKGNVGIGTAAPARRLHVSATDLFTARFESSHANAAIIELRSASSNNTWETAVAGSAAPFGLGAGDMYMYRQGNSEPGFTISSNNFTASLRCADFKMGHPTRRGSPGRALVDNGDHLVVNFANDWNYTYVNGRLKCNILEIAGADVSERFPSDEKNAEPGTVMEIDPDNSGKLRVSREPYNPRVAGVVSGAGDIPVGAVLGNLPGQDNGPAVALSGRVWVRCDASNVAIAAGDLLTTSSTPGHAMKATDRERSHGAVLGKAMTGLTQGERGLVLVLVNLQ